MEAPACKKEGPKGRRRRKAPPERETDGAAGVQKGEAEGEEKAKAPPEPPACKIIQQKAIVPVQQG